MRSMAMTKVVGLVGLVSAALVGCGGGAAQQPGDVTFSLTGASANVQLFDANYQSYCHQNKDWTVTSAIVTVNEIDAKVNGKWVAIEQAPEQVDLLKLDDKTLSTLGVATIPAGKVSGLRLILDQLSDYVVLHNGDKKPLTVPDSGIINITGKIDLDSCAMGTLILDFDPHISTFTHPGLHDYILSGSAKIKTAEVKNACGSTTPPPPDMAGACTKNSDCASSGNGDICISGTCASNPCAGFPCSGGVCSVIAGAATCTPTADFPCNGLACTSQCVVNGSTPICN